MCIFSSYVLISGLDSSHIIRHNRFSRQSTSLSCALRPKISCRNEPTSRAALTVQAIKIHRGLAATKINLKLTSLAVPSIIRISVMQRCHGGQGTRPLWIRRQREREAQITSPARGLSNTSPNATRRHQVTGYCTRAISVLGRAMQRVYLPVSVNTLGSCTPTTP